MILSRLNPLREYVRKNWGLPFLAGFLILLFAAAISLTLGVSSLANSIAVYAFYALALGILLQLVCNSKYRNDNSVTE